MNSQPLVVGSGWIFFLEMDLAALYQISRANKGIIYLHKLTLSAYRRRNFVFVAGDFANNTVEWQRFVIKVSRRLLAKCGAMLHLLTYPDPLLGFQVFKLWEPGFILPRARFCVVRFMIK